MFRTALIAVLALGTTLLTTTPLMAQNPRVLMETDLGPIYIELRNDVAPITTQNFLNYVNEGFFDGLIFHRVVDDFVVQGGGFDRNYVFREPTQPNIVNEGMNGLLNRPRTIAMARQDDLDSANSQFYFNLAANDFLDGTFTVFGEVIGGWDTVEEISGLGTNTQPTPIGNFQDSPRTPPVVKRAYQFSGYPVQAVHAGSWFDPNNGGVGFNIEITNQGNGDNDPIAIIYWYDYSQGNQIWLTGVQGFQWGDSEVTIDLLGVENPVELADFQTPPDNSVLNSRGSVTIRFSGCSDGVFSYNLPDLGTGEIAVTRLSLVNDLPCERYNLDN